MHTHTSVGQNARMSERQRTQAKMVIASITHAHAPQQPAPGEVRVYNERSLVSVHTTAGGAPVMALASGRYAREDNTLVTVTR